MALETNIDIVTQSLQLQYIFYKLNMIIMLHFATGFLMNEYSPRDMTTWRIRSTITKWRKNFSAVISEIFIEIS
jgi:hypothetical protein